MIRFFAAGCVTTSLVVAAGCSSIHEEELGTAEQDSVPAGPSDSFTLAESCSRLFKQHASLRPLDLEQGLIRWGCGDVPGVTEPDFGQEYCEYQAVQNGKPVRKAGDLTTGTVSCVFTAVFTGAGQAARLKVAMADPANLGAAPTVDGVVQMQHDFNARDAATGLIRDCSRQPATGDATRRRRVTAIFAAFAKGGPNAARLKEIGKMTSINEAAWEEALSLGAKIAVSGDADLDEQRDIASCMQVGAGIGWRNSDPMICARVNRSAGECSCRFGAVPSSLQGFPLSGWLDDHIPASCRLAKVAGEDYPFIAICDLTDQEVADLPLNPTHARSFQSFCRDRFGTDIVMKIPLRGLQEPGTCTSSTRFCADYMGTDAVPMEAAAPEAEFPR